MGKIKNCLAYILIVVLSINSAAFNIYAKEIADNDFEFSGTVSNFNDPFELPSFTTSAASSLFSVNNVNLTNTSEVNWIDRIANKPDYAVNFYNWLKNNSGADGALATAEESELSNGAQAHCVTNLTDSVYITFPKNSTDEVITEILENTLIDVISENFYTASEWIFNVLCAFYRDCPEIFWLSDQSMTAYDVSYSYSLNKSEGTGVLYFSENVYYYLSDENFDIRADEFNTQEKIGYGITERDNAVNKILSDCNILDDYGKLKYFNNYLTKNNYYNSSSNLSDTAHKCLSALVGKTGIYSPVCDGYSTAFKVLCDKAEIPCVLVDGLAGESHMWNNVLLDGNWYAVDVTWNDPYTYSDEYISGYENEKYFLIGSLTIVDGVEFSNSHIMRNTPAENCIAFINGPELSKVTYNSTVAHACSLKNGFCTFCSAKANDVNRDSFVDIVDLIRLQTMLLNLDTNGNGDCDSDGNFDSMDYTFLRKNIWNEY